TRQRHRVAGLCHPRRSRIGPPGGSGLLAPPAQVCERAGEVDKGCGHPQLLRAVDPVLTARGQVAQRDSLEQQLYGGQANQHRTPGGGEVLPAVLRFHRWLPFLVFVLNRIVQCPALHCSVQCWVPRPAGRWAGGRLGGATRRGRAWQKNFPKNLSPRGMIVAPDPLNMTERKVESPSLKF